MRRTRRWRKEFPYYKVQVFSEVFQSWTDERRAFDSIREAESYIRAELEGHQNRIVVVEEKGRKILGD